MALAWAAGCKAHETTFKLLDLKAAQAAHTAHAVFVDANTPEFRAKNGVVPGAILLDNYRTYDVATTLPADKNTPLVFYCTSRT